ncbi:MAG: twin-arginine translocation signal domain-containing protein [Anaerolineales bacterium]|nr:twin-arginine translocation signal domain-containing protein [Anaerolineales bacterium]
MDPSAIFDPQWMSRRTFLKLTGASSLMLALAGCGIRPITAPPGAIDLNRILTRTRVPDPKNIEFTVTAPGKAPLRLVGHFWYDADAVAQGKHLPAVVEFNPYRRRDGTMSGDSSWYPYFAYCGYLTFRVDLQDPGTQKEFCWTNIPMMRSTTASR